MHLCTSELGSPSLTSIATLCSCNSTMLRDREWATVRDTQIHRPLKSCKAASPSHSVPHTTHLHPSQADVAHLTLYHQCFLHS